MEKLLDLGISADDGPKRPKNHENKCRDYVGKKVPCELIDVWTVKDENRNGLPDVRYFSKPENPTQRALWVEYKYLNDLPVLQTTMIVPSWNSDLQLRTLRSFARAGDLCRVVIFYGDASDIRNVRAVVLRNAKEWEFGIPRKEAEIRSMPIMAYIEWLTKNFTGD